MEKFTKLTGVAAPMDVINVDTDQIIPKLHLRTIKRTGLGKVLFDDLRFNPDGTEKPGFILNQAPYRDAQILVAGDNFGCGSSREHAPWALLDFGIRCVISTSFADIFYNNCFKNGILPIAVSADELGALMADASDRENPVLTVDLQAQEITRPNGATVRFAIDEFRRECLLDGLDDIGLTMQKVDRIDTFEARVGQREQQLRRWSVARYLAVELLDSGPRHPCESARSHARRPWERGRPARMDNRGPPAGRPFRASGGSSISGLGRRVVHFGPPAGRPFRAFRPGPARRDARGSHFGIPSAQRAVRHTP